MALFEERQVRRLFHNDEWWFVLVDIVSALTDSANPSDYLKKLRRRDSSLADAFEGGDNLSPPFPAVPDRRRDPTASMLERPRHLASDSSHPLTTRRAIQALARQGWS
jgi:hypothetical protein